MYPHRVNVLNHFNTNSRQCRCCCCLVLCTPWDKKKWLSKTVYLRWSNVLIDTLATTQQGIRHKRCLPLCTIYFVFLTFTFSPSVCRKLLWGVWLLRQALASFLMSHNKCVAMKPAKAAEIKRKKIIEKKRKAHIPKKESLGEKWLFIDGIITPRRVNSSTKSTFPKSRAQIRGDDKWLNSINEDRVALSTLFFHFITSCFFMAYSPLKRYSLSSLPMINTDRFTTWLRCDCSHWSSG